MVFGIDLEGGLDWRRITSMALHATVLVLASTLGVLCVASLLTPGVTLT
ncbi:MAG: hypothetical protein IPK81_12285 [Rhodospirillales bacterium]|nr:MAG: hypothetical protein IPK81_12285 [Rhodospirillales bacterium]